MIKGFTGIVCLLAALLAGGIYLFCRAMPRFDEHLLMGGNLLLAALTLGAFALVKARVGGRPQAFVTGVYAGTFLKLMVCMGSFLVYLYTQGWQLHKPSIFVLFGIYAAYTITETVALSKLARTPQQP